jgi:hypothetical protein
MIGGCPGSPARRALDGRWWLCWDERGLYSIAGGYQCVDMRPMAPKLIDIVAEIILEVVVPAHTFWAATGRVTL